MSIREISIRIGVYVEKGEEIKVQNAIFDHYS